VSFAKTVGGACKDRFLVVLLFTKIDPLTGGFANPSIAAMFLVILDG
jgi:hypothetical protein